MPGRLLLSSPETEGLTVQFDPDDESRNSANSDSDAYPGFSAEECQELLSHGVKHWDSDAEDIMEALSDPY